MKYDIIKVASVSPKLSLCKPLLNAEEMIKALKKTTADVVVFPELSLTGYTCKDYFFMQSLYDDINSALKKLLDFSYDGFYIFGMPLLKDGALFNVAVIAYKDKILGVVPKRYFNDNDSVNEKRYFTSAFNLAFNEIEILGKVVPFGTILFTDKKAGINFNVEISNDMNVLVPPSLLLSLVGSNMTLNLGASTITLEKDELRRNIVKEHSRKNAGAYIYTSSGPSESTGEAIFSGHQLHSVLGKVIHEEKLKSDETNILESDIDFGLIKTSRQKNTALKDSLFKFDIEYQEVKVAFKEQDDYEFSQQLDQKPLLPNDTKKYFDEVRDIKYFALLKRLKHLNYPKVILGISGGLDSSYTLLVLVDIFKRLNKDLKDIIAISMPALITSNHTKTNAEKLSKTLGVTFKEIDIKEEVNLHLKMINHQGSEDITYENTQARIRTQTLMNIANQENGIVIGTGSLSEIALGFMTYNADMMSMYALNSGMPKTLIQRQFKNYKEIFPEVKELIDSILNTPISPELKKNQETEKILGSYLENDFLLYRHLVCGDNLEKMRFMLKNAFNLKDKEALKRAELFLNRFYSSQFKRQVMPDGPKIIEIDLSPRGDYQLSSDVRIK